MGCTCCCNRAYASAKKAMEPLWTTLKCLENIPIVGHLLAAFYMFLGDKDKAERSALKATFGIILGILSFPVEIFDEVIRTRSKKLFAFSLSPKPDWMKKYHRRTLRHLCLPGSHQSGTYIMERKLKPIPMVEGWSRCQSLSVEQQLMGGIRFLDFRLMTDPTDKEVWLHHNMVTCEKFRYILDTIQDFITEYPSEIVCIFLSNDGKHLDWGTVNALLNEYLGQRICPPDMREMAIGNLLQIYILLCLL